MNPYPRLLSSFMVVLSMAIFFSCTKTDDALRPPAEATAAEAEQRFFTQHRSSDAVENALVNYIKQQNNQLHFVGKTVKQIGYPRWNKAITIQQKNSYPTARGENGDTTIYYIPFVRDSQNYVNASLAIKVAPSDTSFYYLCDWQYAQLQNSATSISDIAEHYAVFFMKFDKLVFGHTNFKIKDDHLFHGNFTGQVKVRLVESDSNTNNLNSVFTCQTVVISWQDCPYPVGQCNLDGTCDNCWRCTSSVQYQYCTEVWSDNGDGGGGGGTGGGGGSGSGGTGGSSGGAGGTPPDCGGPQGRGIAARGDLPCVEEPGWEPEPIDEDPPAPNPCDSLIQALSSNTTFANNFKSLMSPANLSASFEKGYVINFATGQFEQRQGQVPVNCSSCRGQVNLGSSTPLSGSLHNHLYGTATMFSPTDVVNQMAKLFIENKAQDPSNLFCGVATANGPYIVKVVDTAKFRVMANKIYSPTDSTIAQKYENKNRENFNWLNDSVKNEAGFIRMLNDYKKMGGLAVYKGNSDCTKWSALSVSSSMQGGQVIYTIEKQNCY